MIYESRKYCNFEWKEPILLLVNTYNFNNNYF